MASATYRVRIGWEPLPSNAFFLNGSQLDGSDVLTSQYSNSLNILTFGFSRFSEPGPSGLDTPGTDTFAGAFDSLYADVSQYTKTISSKRGRDGNLNNFLAGEAVITLNDPTSIFSPLNTTSPLYPNVLPGRSVLIEEIYGGVAYPMFSGFVRSIEHNPDFKTRETKVYAQDFFLYLSRVTPTIAATGATTTGAAIRAILTELNWTEARYISLETGDAVPDFSADGTKTALSLIKELLDVEQGEFYISKGGVATYKQRASRPQRAVSATLTEIATEATSATDLENIRNRVTVKDLADTISETHFDGPSTENYGFSDFGGITSPYIVSASQAQNLGQWLVSQAKDPSPPLRDLAFTANISASLFVIARDAELGDRVTVVDSALNANSDFYIEGIQTEVGEGLVKKVAYNLSKVPSNAPLRFGHSRVRDGEYGSPTATVAPYDTVQTTSDVFAY